MGWVESPAYFCSATEIIRDIVQHAMNPNSRASHHGIIQKMLAHYVPPHAHDTSPTCLLQVYVDNFCNAATQSSDCHYLDSISQAKVQSIHSILPPMFITGHEHGKEPISECNLLKGDGAWTTIKGILGLCFSCHT